MYFSTFFLTLSFYRFLLYSQYFLHIFSVFSFSSFPDSSSYACHHSSLFFLTYSFSEYFLRIFSAYFLNSFCIQLSLFCILFLTLLRYHFVLYSFSFTIPTEDFPCTRKAKFRKIRGRTMDTECISLAAPAQALVLSSTSTFRSETWRQKSSKDAATSQDIELSLTWEILWLPD